MDGSADLLKLNPGRQLRERRITSDYVADALREAIQSGALADGAVLNQVAIAERFGVSRVPVREAMRQLQAEGLISSEAHRRAVVRGLSLERIVEIYDLRILVEGYLIERAVPLMTASVLEQARAVEAEMVAIDDHAEWLSLNRRFHDLLYSTSGATTALELATTLRGHAERYVRLWSRGTSLRREREVEREHHQILRSVAKGDATQARLELELHITHTRDRIAESGPADASGNDAPAAS